MSVFDGSQKEVGKGARATVFYHNGFTYPMETIILLIGLIQDSVILSMTMQEAM